MSFELKDSDWWVPELCVCGVCVCSFSLCVCARACARAHARLCVVFVFRATLGALPVSLWYIVHNNLYNIYVIRTSTNLRASLSKPVRKEYKGQNEILLPIFDAVTCLVILGLSILCRKVLTVWSSYGIGDANTWDSLWLHISTWAEFNLKKMKYALTINERICTFTKRPISRKLVLKVSTQDITVPSAAWKDNQANIKH